MDERGKAEKDEEGEREQREVGHTLTIKSISF